MNKRTKEILIGNTPLLVDFKELQEQRSKLTELVEDKFDGDELAGLQCFLDAFVDAAAGVLGEKVVFGRTTK